MSTDIKIENIAILKEKMIAIGDAVRGFTGYGGSLELDDIITELATVATYPLEDLEKPSCEMNRDEKLTLMADIIRYHRDLAKKLSLDDMATQIIEFPGEDAFARIGFQYYKTFNEAFVAAKDGDTITLLKDVDLGTKAFAVNKSITVSSLDVNYPVLLKSSCNKVLFTVTEGAKFKLSNLKIEDENMVVEIPAGQSGFVTIENATVYANHLAYFRANSEGALIVDNVVASTMNTTVGLLDNVCSASIKNSTLSSAVPVFQIDSSCSDILIDNSVIRSTDNSLYAAILFRKCQNGTLTIQNGSKVEAKYNAIEARSLNGLPFENSTISIMDSDVIAEKRAIHFLGAQNCVLTVSNSTIKAANTYGFIVDSCDALTKVYITNNSKIIGEAYCAFGIFGADNSTIEIDHSVITTDGGDNVIWVPHGATSTVNLKEGAVVDATAIDAYVEGATYATYGIRSNNKVTFALWSAVLGVNARVKGGEGADFVNARSNLDLENYNEAIYIVACYGVAALYLKTEVQEALAASDNLVSAKVIAVNAQAKHYLPSDAYLWDFDGVDTYYLVKKGEENGHVTYSASLGEITIEGVGDGKGVLVSGGDVEFNEIPYRFEISSRTYRWYIDQTSYGYGLVEIIDYNGNESIDNVYDYPIRKEVDKITDGGTMDVVLVCKVAVSGSAYDEAGCASGFNLVSEGNFVIKDYNTSS